MSNSATGDHPRSPAPPPPPPTQEEDVLHRDEHGDVICISQWSSHINGHMISKATEECLVTALVDGYDQSDPNYVDDFLLLFRIFLKPNLRDQDLPAGMVNLCFTLLKWLDYTNLRNKVVKVIITWISLYYHDFELKPEFSQYFFTSLETKLFNLSMHDQLNLLYFTKSQQTKTSVPASPISEANSPLMTPSSQGSEFNFIFNFREKLRLDHTNPITIAESPSAEPPIDNVQSLDPILLAVELTLIDFDKFKSIKPQQFVYDSFCNTDENGNPQTVIDQIDGQVDIMKVLNKSRSIPSAWTKEFEDFANSSNTQMFWVVNEVVHEKKKRNRIEIIKQFIQVACICERLRNYNSMFAIISGLGHSCVSRLKRTFSKLDDDHKKELETMRNLFDPSRNMLNYRNRLAQTRPPAIPLFPQIKKDLTFTKEGRSIFARDPERGNILVNFGEIRQFANRVRDITHYSTVAYSKDTLLSAIDSKGKRKQATIDHELSIRKRIRYYITHTMTNAITYDERVLYLRSLDIEPQVVRKPPQVMRPPLLPRTTTIDRPASGSSLTSANTSTDTQTSKSESPPPLPPKPPILPPYYSPSFVHHEKLTRLNGLNPTTTNQQPLPRQVPSAVPRFGTKSEENLRKLRALRENG